MSMAEELIWDFFLIPILPGGKERGGVGWGQKTGTTSLFSLCFQESRERKVSVKVKIKIPRLPTP